MANAILVKPIITEKTTKLGEKYNRYAFRVDKEANKLQVKKAVEAAYSVTVEDVNILVNPAKAKTRFTKQGVARGVKASFKKAYVTLKAGESIDFYGAV